MQPKLKRDWVGLLVKTNVTITTNGGTVFPARTVMKVRRNFGGLHLECWEACDQCQIKGRHRIKGVSERDVTIIDRPLANRIVGENKAAKALMRAAMVWDGTPDSEKTRALIAAAKEYKKFNPIL